jgi:hypothetical protein
MERISWLAEKLLAFQMMEHLHVNIQAYVCLLDATIIFFLLGNQQCLRYSSNP